jgi:transcriptional regulator with XRE-family HTH domain
MNIMNRLKLLRKRENITLRTLAKYADISNPILSYLETEKRPFRQIHIDKLVAFFSITTDFLLGRSDYGYIVMPEYGDGEIVLVESEYERLADNIKTSILNRNTPTQAIRSNDSVVESVSYIPKYFIYRELKGELADYSVKESRQNTLIELSKRMTSDEIDKTINFIREYIFK